MTEIFKLLQLLDTINNVIPTTPELKTAKEKLEKKIALIIEKHISHTTKE